MNKRILLIDKKRLLRALVDSTKEEDAEKGWMLFREFELVCFGLGFDLKKKVDEYNKKNNTEIDELDYADTVMGKVPELYELAAKLFENDVKELVDEMYNLCKKVA